MPNPVAPHAPTAAPSEDADVSPGLLAVQTCLDSGLARAFALGDLAAPCVERIDAHIDRCPACHALVVAALAAPARARAELAPDARLAGRYRIVRFIGRGGMGEIYEAVDETLGERVALKCLAPALAENPRGVEYLKSEAQLARKVSHPNVCRVYDFGSDGEGTPAPRFFLTMELLSGGPLSGAIARGALPPALVANFSRQLLLGLREAHRAGVLHRDFKSDNVLFRSAAAATDERQLVITDFGLSRLVSGAQSHITASNMCVGSAAYMAPEQVEGGRLAQTTDIYSFGVVVFEMLTGTLPFVSDTALATAVARLRAPAPRPSQRAPHVPRAWDDFVLRCLEREPARRFASADAALEALEQVARSAAGARARGVGNRHVAWGLGAGALVAASYAWFSPQRPAPAHAPARAAASAHPEPASEARDDEQARAEVTKPAGVCTPSDGSAAQDCAPALAPPGPEPEELPKVRGAAHSTTRERAQAPSRGARRLRAPAETIDRARTPQAPDANPPPDARPNAREDASRHSQFDRLLDPFP